jgi:uncharacterized protein YfaT (DUF1175 family)
MGALVAILLCAEPPPLERVRSAVAEVALAQVERPDDRWPHAQRDCAGLIRFSLRTAYRRVWPERLKTPLFQSLSGPADFADAETLLTYSFVGVGRDLRTAELRTGDVIAFRQPRASGDAFHLMLVVSPPDKAHGGLHVVYHPGERDAAVRAGRLVDLMRNAPGEWRPVPENASFLGFFRFKEWIS